MFRSRFRGEFRGRKANPGRFFGRIRAISAIRGSISFVWGLSTLRSTRALALWGLRRAAGVDWLRERACYGGRGCWTLDVGASILVVGVLLTFRSFIHRRSSLKSLGGKT